MEKFKTSQEFNRVEWKYPIKADVYERLIGELRKNIIPDVFPKYPVYNIYYDTPDSRIVSSSLDTSRIYKEKLRLRSYGIPSASVPCFLEIKKKHGIWGEKRRIHMNPETAGEYVRGNFQSEGGSHAEREIQYFIRRHPDLIPGCFIAYDREAYSGKNPGEEDLRITFDRNIRYRWNPEEIRENGEEIFLNYKDDILMEIKASGAYPLWLSHVLAEYKLYRVPYSKYGTIYTKENAVPYPRAACTKEYVADFREKEIEKYIKEEYRYVQ